MNENKVAIVTGGARGIGKAIVDKLASMGIDIAIIYGGSKEAAIKLAEQCSNKYKVKAIPYQCDVADFEKTKELVKQIKEDFGTCHYLINNAGITRDSLIPMMKENDFDDVIATNLKGTFNMIRHCSGFFIRNKRGHIVNISSVSGIMGNIGQGNYAASKAGLVGLSKSVAKELATKNICCNCIAPGFIETEMTENQKDNPIVKSIPLGRMGKASEVAEAVAFLISSNYITGEVIRIDGGIAI